MKFEKRLVRLFEKGDFVSTPRGKALVVDCKEINLISFIRQELTIQCVEGDEDNPDNHLVIMNEKDCIPISREEYLDRE